MRAVQIKYYTMQITHTLKDANAHAHAHTHTHTHTLIYPSDILMGALSSHSLNPVPAIPDLGSGRK